jgi:hypothetical protein
VSSNSLVVHHSVFKFAHAMPLRSVRQPAPHLRVRAGQRWAAAPRGGHHSARCAQSAARLPRSNAAGRGENRNGLRTTTEMHPAPTLLEQFRLKLEPRFRQRPSVRKRNRAQTNSQTYRRHSLSLASTSNTVTLRHCCLLGLHSISYLFQ